MDTELQPLSLREFLCRMFEANEQQAAAYSVSLQPDTMPYTDEQLEELVRQNFSEFTAVISSLDVIASNVRSRIRIWRSEYNRGLWNEKPTYRSFRYGSDGVPINRQLHALDAKLVAEDIRDFPFPDPRKEVALKFLAEGTANACTKP